MPFTNPPQPVQSITIPTGATTGPRIVIGNKVPAVLTTWATLNGATINSVILEYWNTTDFYWRAVGSFGGNNTSFEGTYDTSNGVLLDTHLVNIVGASTEIIGSNVNPTSFKYQLQNASIVAGTDTETIRVGGANVPVIVGCSSTNGAGLAQTNTSATYIDLSGAVSLTFNKGYGSSISTLLIFGYISCFSATTGSTQVTLGCSVGGSPHDLVNFPINPVSTNFPVFGAVKVLTNIPGTGNVVCKLQWKRSSGTGTLTMDASAWTNLTVVEVPL